MIKGEITKLRASPNSGEAIIEPSDRFDVRCRKDFECAADMALVLTTGEILIDLRNVQYLDTTALGALLQARSKAQAAGKKIVLLNANPRIMEILEIANFVRLFEMMAGKA